MADPVTGSLISQITPAIASGVMGIGQSIIGNSMNRSNMDKQVRQSKELMNYQWDNFMSPRAQAKAYADAGLNPAVIFGQGGQGAVAAPSASMPSSSHIPVDLTGGMDSIANYLLSVSQAKKAGMDTKLSEQEIKNKQVEESRNKFQYDLEQEFGRHEWTSKIANEYMKLILASDSSDLNEQEKALNEYRLAISDIEKQIKGDEREMVAQRLANNPTAISLENRIKDTQAKSNLASASASYAASESYRTQADVNRENRRLQAALADIEESSKTDKIESLIARYNAEGAMSDADYREAALRLKYLKWRISNRADENRFEDIDNLAEWLKDKVSIIKLGK